MESYFQSNDHQFELFKGDATECLNNMSNQFDLIFADPPYFLSRGYSSKINGEWKSFEKGEWDRATSLDNINEFNRRWLSACRNVLKDDGTIWVSGTYHNIFFCCHLLSRVRIQSAEHHCMAKIGCKAYVVSYLF